MDDLELLRKKILEDKLRYEDSILSGNASDFAEYRRLCGVLSGICIALDHVNTRIEANREEKDE